MELWKKVLICVAALTVGWHLVMVMTPRIRLAGLFLVKPDAPGYVWTDANNADGRFFWSSQSTKWLAGVAHPEFNAEAAPQEGDWNPMPGYSFVDKTQDLNTVWKQGLKHPDYMAWSDDVEGKWIPVTGYRFIYEGDTFVDSVWDPNKRYDDVNVMSLAEKDHYRPYPGYVFTEPGQSLNVVWMPGTINPDNSRLIAGTQEGSWSVKPSSSPTYRPRARRSSNEAAWFVGGVAAGVLLRSL